MTATYGALSQVVYGSRVNTTITLPASVGDSDLLILGFVTANAGTAVSGTMPAGFTTMGVEQSGSDGSFGWKFKMGWRIASSEPADYTITHASTNCEALMIRIDGTEAALSVEAFSQNQIALTSVTTTALSVDPSTMDDLLLFLGINWDVIALTPPTGMTERQDASFLYLATETLANGYPTNDRTQTHNNNPWFGNLIAVKDYTPYVPPDWARRNWRFG